MPPEFLHAAAKSTSVLALIMVLSNVGAVYEAIVMGGHRIDLARNFATFFTVAEAVAIVILLHFGYGLFAMASVMAASEVGFVLCCYVSSKKILPQVRVSRMFVTTKVIPELVRFAGSYQLVNVLEVLYLSILPVTVLRAFGADAAGIYALATRLVMSAVMLSDAFLLPILSGGAMVYASGSQEEMRKLITKSFKITLGLCSIPAGVHCGFRTNDGVCVDWTGGFVVASCALAGMRCGLLSGVLHTGVGVVQSFRKRASRQHTAGLAHRVLALDCDICAPFGILRCAGGIGSNRIRRDGIHDVCDYQDLSRLSPKISAARCFETNRGTAAVLVAGAIATRIPLPPFASVRWLAVLELGKVSLACLLAAWPALCADQIDNRRVRVGRLSAFCVRDECVPSDPDAESAQVADMTADRESGLAVGDDPLTPDFAGCNQTQQHLATKHLSASPEFGRGVVNSLLMRH